MTKYSFYICKFPSPIRYCYEAECCLKERLQRCDVPKALRKLLPPEDGHFVSIKLDIEKHVYMFVYDNTVEASSAIIQRDKVPSEKILTKVDIVFDFDTDHTENSHYYIMFESKLDKLISDTFIKSLPDLSLSERKRKVMDTVCFKSQKRELPMNDILHKSVEKIGDKLGLVTYTQTNPTNYNYCKFGRSHGDLIIFKPSFEEKRVVRGGVVVGAETSTLEAYTDLNVICGFAELTLEDKSKKVLQSLCGMIQSASFIIEQALKNTKCEIDKVEVFGLVADLRTATCKLLMLEFNYSNSSSQFYEAIDDIPINEGLNRIVYHLVTK